MNSAGAARAIPPPDLVPPYSALAPMYDAYVGDRDFARTRAAFETIVRRYRIRFGSAVDLGCGTGLFARYLRVRWRVPVFAVDSSPRMLEVARRNCREDGIRFLLQDFRCLKLPARVDLATANTMTLNHLLTPSDMQLVFRRIHGALRPGSHLVFDLFTDRPPWESRRTYFAHHFGRSGQFVQELRWEPRARLLVTTVHHRGTAPAIAIETYVGRGYAPEDVADWLARCGFTIRTIADAETLRPADRTASRAIVVARYNTALPA